MSTDKECNYAASYKENLHYFGIDLSESAYNNKVNLFFYSTEMVTINNKYQLISKQDVVKILKSTFKSYNLSYYRIKISKELIQMNSIEDCFGKNIFGTQKNNNTTGWFIFIDPFIDANWSHKCEYWFIRNEGCLKKESNQNWPPSSVIELEEIDLNGWGMH